MEGELRRQLESWGAEQSRYVRQEIRAKDPWAPQPDEPRRQLESGRAEFSCHMYDEIRAKDEVYPRPGEARFGTEKKTQK